MLSLNVASSKYHPGNLLVLSPILQRSSEVVVHILCLWWVYWYWTINCDAVLRFLVMDIIFKMLLGILCHLIGGLPVILSVFRDCFGACPFRCHGAFLFFFGIPRSLFSWGFSIAVGCGCGVALDGSRGIWGWLLSSCGVVQFGRILVSVFRGLSFRGV